MKASAASDGAHASRRRSPSSRAKPRCPSRLAFAAKGVHSVLRTATQWRARAQGKAILWQDQFGAIRGSVCAGRRGRCLWECAHRFEDVGHSRRDDHVVVEKQHLRSVSKHTNAVNGKRTLGQRGHTSRTRRPVGCRQVCNAVQGLAHPVAKPQLDASRMQPARMMLALKSQKTPRFK
eukprot:6183454-Pleurochrysis_carterae.AAC.3